MTEPTTDDVEALRSLAVRYASGVDRRRADLLISAFHADAVLVVHQPNVTGSDDPPRHMRGHAEIRRVVERIAKYPVTFHLLGQSHYEVHGDRADGEVYCTANHYVRGESEDSNHVMYIRYQDEYRRDPGGPWRIERRDVRPEWMETHPVRAAGPDATGGRS